MKTTHRLVALLLALVMVISCAPLSIFAADTASSLSYESTLYSDETLLGYKQYEAMWSDPTYVKADVKYTVYFDTENATETRDVVFYVINWNGERIGTDSDIDIVTELIKAPASVESGNRWAVVVVDFGKNTLAKSPNIELSLAALRADLPGKLKLTVWADSTQTTTTTVPVHEDHVYVLPAGYKVARDIPYYETDYHASLGTRDYVVSGWNSHIAWNDDLVASVYQKGTRRPKAVEYAWHTGDTDTCSYDHTTYADVECYPGAPQEIKKGEVVEVVAYKNIVTHTGDVSTCPYPHDQLKTKNGSSIVNVTCKSGSTVNINWAPVVTRYEDLRKPDGSPLDYVCRLDIIYPSGENVEATPVMVQAATQSPRMTNVGTISSSDYDKDGTASLKNRTMLIGMEFSGYTVAVYDYAYSPMARGDHYGYIDPYGTHGSNGAKTSRAAIRCIRYFAEQYGYNDKLIGVAGISKGTPTTAVLSTVDNKYVDEASTFKYDIDGSGTKVETRDLWYEGDINDAGLVTAESTTVVQPYLTYEAGYNGKKIDGEDVNYSVTRTGEISSDVSVVYCAAGDGINRVYKGDESIILGGTNPNSGKETQHVPMVLSCGYYDEYNCWDHWESIQNRFTEYADYPFLAIGMEDMGHDYPSGIDPMRDYDRYNAYMQFFHSVLNPEIYTPQVAWMMPVDGETGVALGQSIQVQLVKPATTLDAFVAATTVKDVYGEDVEGTWTTNGANTSGLYTFVPEAGYTGGLEYTVTVGTPVVAAATSKSFTVEAAGFLRPVADTYVSEIDKTGVFGAEKTLYIDNQRTYLATFNTADFEDANRANLVLPLTGTGKQTLSVYLLDGFSVNEETTCYNNIPELTDDKLISTYKVSEGDSTVNLLGIVSMVKNEQFTIAIKGSAHYYELDFEEYSSGTALTRYDANKYNTTPNAPEADDCYSEYFVWRTGGATQEMTAAEDPDGSDNMVAAVTSTQKYNRIRWYNTFVRDKAYFDSSDIGRTFNMSFDLRIKAADSAAPQMSYALDAVSGTLTTYTPKPTADTWTTVTKTITVDESMVTAKRAVLSFTLNGTIGCTYYFDDIIVKEQAPTELVSLENTTAMTAYITTSYEEENGVVADTYVSAAQPDVALGKSDKLLLNGGDSENIIFVTYPSKLIKGNTNIQFTIPAEDNASLTAEVLLLDGYFVDEEQLTYNTMPDLTKAVSLGKYTLTGGINTIEIENAVEKIKGNYFTVVFRTDDSLETVYFKNFEDYAVGDDVNTSSYNVTDSTTTDSSGVNYTYYYAHLADDTDSKMYIARSGGAAAISNPLGNVLADPSDADNLTVNLKLSSSATYNGRIKIYNTISDSLLTATDPLIGQTFRFSVRVKAAKQATIDNGCKVYACPMLSIGSTPISANGVQIKSETVTVSDEWQTLTVDYTLSADDIKVAGTANSKPAWGYPTFTLEFTNINAGNEFLIDDLSVVKLNSDGTVSRLDIASSEGAKKSDETIGMRTRSAKDPVADTYVSEANKAGVFGFEDTLYIDSARTYLATFKTADFSGVGDTILNLPLAGSGSQTLSVYLLDGFSVDESKTCYNNIPELTSDKLIGTYEASEGNCKINLLEAIGGVESDYFTVAISGTARYYELNFEDYTATTTVSEHDNNVADTVNTDIYHMYPFASADKLKPLTTRRGGSLGTRQITSSTDGMVLSVTTNTEVNYGGYLKFYNFLQDSADDDIVGKTFNYSVDVKLTGDNSVAESATTKPRIKAGIMRTGSNEFLSGSSEATYADLSANNNGWVTLSGQYTIAADEIGKAMTSQWPPINRYSYPMFGMYLEHVGVASGGSYTYFVDNMAVSEEAPSAVVALDSIMGETACIVVGTDIIADTYVSKANPDTAYGEEETLRFGDEGGDKKALVLSFMNSALDEKNYVELSLNNSGAALKDVSVYYVLDYCADETSLTWNTMPEYEENLLGVYDIAVGDNKLDLSALRDKLTGEYFTLVLRTENHTFREDFDSYSVGTTFVDGTSGGDNNIADTTDSTRNHYHSFFETVYNASKNTVITRRNGDLPSRNVISDGENNVLAVTTRSDVAWGGKLKFYNSLNDSLITKESDIVGKTFRFTAKVRLDPDAAHQTNTDNIYVSIAAYTSYTQTALSEVDTAKYAALSSDWTTLSVDYTVSADDIAEPLTSSGKTHYSYPIFGLAFNDNDNTASNKYLVDDLTVVEVVDGVAVGDAVFGSREAASNDVRFASMLNGNVTILEATVSSASSGDVISIVENGETHSLLKAEGGKLVFGDTVLCDEEGNDIVLTAESVKAVAIYDDTKGTVRFAVGDFLGYYKDAEGNVKATFEHLIIDGGVGNDAVFGNSGITATKLAHTTAEIIGFQTHYIDKAVRFISGVDTIYYNAVGFKLESASNTRTVGSTVVYSSILGADKDIYADEYGYNLMSAISITDVKNGGVVKVTPFLRVGQNYIYGEEVFYKIMVGNEITVVETNESEFGAESNADLASVTVDGEPVVGFSADVTEYNVPAQDVTAMNIVAVPAVAEATVSVSQSGNIATVTVAGFDGITKKVYTFTAYEKLVSEVVNKNGANAIVTYVFDDGDKTTATIVTDELSTKYDSLAGSFALITKNLGTLSTIEGEEGDGLLEYEFDDNGDYVYTKNDTNWTYWETLLGTYGDSGFEAVSHTHTHAYIGENDNGGAFEYRNTNGDVFTSDVFPIGNVRKEYYASNQILRDLGQRAYTLVSAGLTAGGYMIDYTDSYKALPQTSGAFIGKRTTYTYPKDPESMVNVIADFDSEDFRFNVKSYMVQHYNTSSTAPTSTSADTYSKEACMEAGVGYWTDYIDTAVEMGGWAAFCFHNIRPDTHTGTTGHFVYQSQADAVFAHTEQLSEENKVWVANFTDACLYVFERATSEVGAYIDGTGNVVVSLDDKEDDEIFTMPLTVKVALPTGKSSATLDGNALTAFVEDEVTYVYVDIVPGNSVILAVE